MNVILGIDAGLTTGFCLLHHDGTFILGGVTQAPDIYGSMLAGLAQSRPDMGVVVEYPVLLANTHLGKQLWEVVSKLSTLFPDAQIIRPGEWKTSAVGQAPIPDELHPMLQSTHERDAYRIALYYLRRNAHVRQPLDRRPAP